MLPYEKAACQNSGNVIDTVVLGAAFAGLGYALTHPDTLILEETETPGVDYCGIFRCFPDLSELSLPPFSQPVMEFCAFLREHDVLKGSFLDPLRLFPALCRYLQLKLNAEIRLDAQLITIEKEGPEEFTVTYRTNSGIHQIKTRHILDATDRHISDRSYVTEVQRSLNAVIHRTSGKETLESFPIDPQMSLQEARLQIIQWAAEGQQEQDPPHIDVIGFDFEITSDSVPGRACPYAWLNPHAFHHPLEAMEAGSGFAF